jgi:hypothetical protein
MNSGGNSMMKENSGEIIVGVLGQWASGKSTAAKTLVRYLGGEGKTRFITDREFVVSQAVNLILGPDYSEAVISTEQDGRQRFDSEFGTVWLEPGEDPKTVDLNTLRLDLPDDIYDQELPAWLNNARLEIGQQILAQSAEGKPIVIEAGYGKYPSDHTIADLFGRLEEAGVEPKRVRWMIIEAGFDKRSQRNAQRRDTVPDHLFVRYAADGGDLDPDQQKRLEEQGTKITRVPNNHDDFEKFKADIITAYEEMVLDVSRPGETS